jgi:hypothetical protein
MEHAMLVSLCVEFAAKKSMAKVQGGGHLVKTEKPEFTMALTGYCRFVADTKCELASFPGICYRCGTFVCAHHLIATWAREEDAKTNEEEKKAKAVKKEAARKKKEEARKKKEEATEKKVRDLLLGDADAMKKVEDVKKKEEPEKEKTADEMAALMKKADAVVKKMEAKFARKKEKEEALKALCSSCRAQGRHMTAHVCPDCAAALRSDKESGLDAQFDPDAFIGSLLTEMADSDYDLDPVSFDEDTPATSSSSSSSSAPTSKQE